MIFTAYADGWMDLPGRVARCAFGPAGVIAGGAKREGDGATPAGLWPIRRVLWRPDRGPAPASRLPVSPISPADGWCDAPDDAAYNQPVGLPYPASAERLWREDHVYDGRTYLGRFLLDEKTRKAKAFNSKGKSIGEFVGFKAAAAAVGQIPPSLKRKHA